MMRYATLMMLILLLFSCGGNNNSLPSKLSYYIDPIAVQVKGRDVSPYSSHPVEPQFFNIIGGTPPFTVSSQLVGGTQNALPAIVMGADGRSFTATPAQVNTETVITITSTDATGQQASSTFTVDVPTLSVATGSGDTSVTIPQDGSALAQLFITGGAPGISGGADYYSIDASNCGNLVDIGYDVATDPFSFTVAGTNSGTGSCTIIVSDSTEPTPQTASLSVTIQ